MKRLIGLGVAIVVAVFLAAPGYARQGRGQGGGNSSGARLSSHAPKPNTRSNKGGKVRGRERAEEVQEMNKRADRERGFDVAPGVEKAEAGKTGKKSHKRNRN